MLWSLGVLSLQGKTLRDEQRSNSPDQRQQGGDGLLASIHGEQIQSQEGDDGGDGEGEDDGYYYYYYGYYYDDQEEGSAEAADDENQVLKSFSFRTNSHPP
jgi:hypothetical protein